MLIKNVILVFVHCTNVVYSRIYNKMFIFMAFHLKFPEINSNHYMHNKYKYKTLIQQTFILIFTLLYYFIQKTKCTIK